MSPEKDVLSNMFSSFVTRKTKACSPTPSPPLSLHQVSTSPSSPSPLVLLPQISPVLSTSAPTSATVLHAPQTTYSTKAGVKGAASRFNMTGQSVMIEPPNSYPQSIQNHRHHRLSSSGGNCLVPSRKLNPHYHREQPQILEPFQVDSAPTKTHRQSRSRTFRLPTLSSPLHVNSQQQIIIAGDAQVSTAASATTPLTSSGATAATAAAAAALVELPSVVADPSFNLAPQQSSHSLNTTRNYKNNGSRSSNSDRQTRNHNQHLHITVQNKNETDGNEQRLGTDEANNSVHGGRGSPGSVEAIATDSTAAATPFHCDRCSKAFRQRSQLSRHFLRVHERKKPFGCAHCDKCFASAFDRKRHVEAVHGRRCIEFFCDRCSFRSKQESDLEQHIRNVHERDQCRLCGKTFKRAANLVAHERHYHSKTT